jgi:hypothetical protein
MTNQETLFATSLGFIEDRVYVHAAGSHGGRLTGSLFYSPQMSIGLWSSGVHDALWHDLNINARACIRPSSDVRKRGREPPDPALGRVICNEAYQVNLRALWWQH